MIMFWETARILPGFTYDFLQQVPVVQRSSVTWLTCDEGKACLLCISWGGSTPDPPQETKRRFSEGHFRGFF